MKFIIVFLFGVISYCNSVPLHEAHTRTTTECGLPSIPPDTSSSIIGGKDAIPYSWPWQVALFYGSFTCSGTLISNQWVMTAGHCAKSRSASKFQLKLGVVNRTKNDESGEQILTVSEVHVHPKFQSVGSDGVPVWDIALLKLTKPIQFTDHISTVCLPAAQDEELPPAGTLVFLTGWGNTRSANQSSETLKQVSVPLVEVEECKDAYSDHPYDENVMLCVGLKEGGKGTCQGDSGGPAVVQDKNSGRWKQIGITSWAHGCADKRRYGVDGKVPAFIDFIKQYVPDL